MLVECRAAEADRKAGGETRMCPFAEASNKADPDLAGKR